MSCCPGKISEQGTKLKTGRRYVVVQCVLLGNLSWEWTPSATLSLSMVHWCCCKKASDCGWLRTISTARPRVDYVQGYICLLCTSETAHTPCPIHALWESEVDCIEDVIYVFPTEGSAAFAAVNISDGVVSGCHWAVIRFAFNDIYTVAISWRK